MAESEHPADIRTERLASILKKWTDGQSLAYFQKLPKQDLIDSGIPREELELNGLITSEGKPQDIPKRVGQRGFAELVSRLYGITVYQVMVGRWIKEGMPGAIKKSGQIDPSLSLPWVEANKVDGGKVGSILNDAAAAKARTAIVDLEIREMERDRIKRELDASWMDKRDASMTVTAAVLAHHSLVKKEMDRFEKRLSAQGFSQEQFDLIRQACRDVVEQIEKDCEQYGN